MSTLGRLKNLLQNLQRIQDLFESYDPVIQRQLAERVLEKVNDKANCDQRELYLPQKTVICKNAESTKLLIVYDASAMENSRTE